MAIADTSATYKAISLMDEALGWLFLIPADMIRERQIMLLRANNWIWQRIGQQVGLSHEGARKAHLAGVRLIVRELARRNRREGW